MMAEVKLSTGTTGRDDERKGLGWGSMLNIKRMPV